jgi:uncharacterized integral membrane protein
LKVVRWIIGAALFTALLLFSLQNAEPVTLRLYHGWSWQAPLIFVVLLAFATGVAAGLLAGAMRAARLKRTIRRMRRARLARETPPAPHGAAPGPRGEHAASAAGYGQGGPLDGV